MGDSILFFYLGIEAEAVKYLIFYVRLENYQRKNIFNVKEISDETTSISRKTNKKIKL